MTESKKQGDLATIEGVPKEQTGSPPAVLNFGSSTQVDVSGLPEEEVAALRRKHAEDTIALRKKAEELKIDVGAFDVTVDNMVGHTTAATEAGSHITITHAQENATGKTEVVTGNTDRAAAGKVEPDRTLLYVIIAAVAAVVVALIIAGGAR